MSENSTETQNRFFQFNWEAFNVIAGIKFAVVTLVMMLLTQLTNFDFLIILIAAFLAWLTDVPGSTKNRVIGMIAFAVAGIATIWLAGAVYDNRLWFTVAIFLIAFVFTLPMALSQRGYMVGWSTILLFFSIAPMTTSGDLVSFSWDVLIGITAVVLITLFWPAGIGPYGRAKTNDAKDAGGVEDHTFSHRLLVNCSHRFSRLDPHWLAVINSRVQFGSPMEPFLYLGPVPGNLGSTVLNGRLLSLLASFLGLLLVDFIDSTLVLTSPVGGLCLPRPGSIECRLCIIYRELHCRHDYDLGGTGFGRWPIELG